MKKLFLILFLTSCSNQNFDKLPLNFKDDLSFDEFNQLLIQYSKQSPFPDIDK